jgi:hypothetical protein
MTAAALAPAIAFRLAVYQACSRRADALLDLLDALLIGGPSSSLVQLSLAAPHRRGWGSLYAALAAGRLDAALLRELLVRLPLSDGQPIYAVDVSTWPRCDAETSPDRGYYYHPSRHAAGQPIIAGWAYQWVAQLGFAHDSWTAPVEVRRLHPSENTNRVAVEQLRALLVRLGTDTALPLFVFDAGYDPVQLQQGVEGTGAAVLVRRRSGRCCSADTVPTPGANGRPRRHGRKFDCGDETTGSPPTDELQTTDAQYGEVRVRAWSDLHPKQQHHPGRGTRGPRAIVRGTLILVEVSRLPARVQKPRALWLWWAGPAAPDLSVLWRAYVRRFDLEHTFRFVKQTLNWTTPRVRLPEQADRWTWLVIAAYTLLRLLKPAVRDRRLPWERPLAPEALTPCRVRRGLSALLPLLGTPAAMPKPAGRSPGRPKGRRSGRATRHPAIKKAA